jgi:hypothetical protein
MNTQYNSQEWAAETTRGRHLFNYNFRLLGREFKVWQLRKAEPMQEDAGGTEYVYLWQGQRDHEREMVRVTVKEQTSWRLAQKRLREQLNNCMRPDIPRGTGEYASLGDISFVSRDPQTGVPGAIFFTRGNVFLSVDSVGEGNIDVSEFAITLDRALSEPPARSARQKRPAGKHTAKMLKLKMGESRVVTKLQKPAPDGPWLKVIAPDGELSRRGDALSFTSLQAGEKAIDIYVTNPGDR